MQQLRCHMSGRAWGEGGKVEGKEDERRVWSVSEMEERCEGKRGGGVDSNQEGEANFNPSGGGGSRRCCFVAAAAAALLLLLQLLLCCCCCSCCCCYWPDVTVNYKTVKT